jgi:hypothetical protein
MRELPRPIRHEKERVANRPDNVVDQIIGAESTVSALVSDDPYSGEDAALAHPIRGISEANRECAVTDEI